VKITKEYLVKVIKEELEGELPEDPGLPQERTGPDGPSDVGEDYNGKGGNRRTEWRLNGKLHREDGPAVEWADGAKEWYLDGKLHREGGPALEGFSGHEEYWFKGSLHRKDGPAVVHADGHEEYWVDGKKVKPFKRRN
jgi:hypothetical protein